MKDILNRILEFLTKFYDKLILGVILIFLASVLVLQTQNLEKTRQDVRQADADIAKSFPETAIEELGTEEFKLVLDVNQDRVWLEAFGEGTMFDAANYVYAIDGDANLLHFSTFRSPFTKKVDLPSGVDGPPAGPGEGIDEGNRDSDGDGISDSVEDQIGLNRNDPADGEGDLDEDGFSNIEEFTEGTKIEDALSHPPLVRRVRFLREVRTQIPILLKNITRNNDDNPDNWDISVKVRKGRRWKSALGLRVGSRIPNTKYSITDADFKNVKIRGLPEQIPIISISREEGEPVTLVKDRKAYEPAESIELVNLYKEPFRRFKRSVNESFVLEDNHGKKESYRLVESADGYAAIAKNSNKKIAIPKLTDKDKEDAKNRKKAKAAGGMPPEMMVPGMDMERMRERFDR